MTKQFEFETGDGTMLEVHVNIECRDSDGCDSTFDIEWLGPLSSDTEMDIKTLSDADQVRLERACETVAYDNACYAYQEHAEGMADAAYDAWKERDA